MNEWLYDAASILRYIVLRAKYVCTYSTYMYVLNRTTGSTLQPLMHLALSAACNFAGCKELHQHDCN